MEEEENIYRKKGKVDEKIREKVGEERVNGYRKGGRGDKCTAKRMGHMKKEEIIWKTNFSLRRQYVIRGCHLAFKNLASYQVF